MQIRCTSCGGLYEPGEDFSAAERRCTVCRTEPDAVPVEEVPAPVTRLRDPASFAADLMNRGSTKFRAKKALLNAGLGEEAAVRAVEEGAVIHARDKAWKRLRGRMIGVGVMLLGLVLTAVFAFAIEGVFIVVFATLTLTFAGLIAIIAPDTLESFGDWFGGGPAG